MAALAKVIGSVDGRHRPLIRVRFVGRDDDVLAIVDTGFNGQVMMASGDARLLGVTLLEDNEEVELGHGKKVDVRLGEVRIEWLDEQHRVSVFVSERPEPTREGEPVMLLGTKLLSPHLLFVDFDARTVEIETQ